MAHKKAAGSAKNLRDSNPKYRGVKIYGGQHATAGAIIIRQKGDKYKSGKNVYLGKDFTLHASITGLVSFRKKKVMRYDGRKYIKTFVDVLPVEDVKTPVKKAPAKAAAKKTAPAKKVTAEKTVAKKAPAKKAAPTKTAAADVATMTVKDLKAKAKSLSIKGYSTMKKDDLIKAIKAS